MPKPLKKKKKFIRKKESTTYRLIPGYVPDYDDELKESVDEIDARKEEQREYGIFYNDSYNYMRHLRSVTEEASLVNVNPKGGTDDEVASTVRSSYKPFKEFFSTDSTKEIPIDPEILAALDEAPEIKMEDTDLEGENAAVGGLKELLDDDFLEKAGGVEILQEEEEQDFDSDQYLSSDEDDGSGFDGSDFEEEDEEDLAAHPHSSRGNAQDDIIEAQTALILRNFEEGLGFTCSAQLSDDEEMKPTSEDYEHLKSILKHDKFNEKPVSWSEVLDDREDRPKLDTSRYIYEDVDEYEWKEVPPSKPKFDCVSILSLNSNTRNLPTDIIPPKAQKSRLPSVSESMQSEVPGLTMSQIEEEMRENRRADRASTFRPNDESAEEKRMRKKAIKDERKERRVEKKANKTVFSIENTKMHKETAALAKSGRGLKIC